jgi:hypothetical protein
MEQCSEYALSSNLFMQIPDKSPPFFHPDAWWGGFYELSMEFEPDSDLRQAFNALWCIHDLLGCYLNRDVDHNLQIRIKPNDVDLNEHPHVYGLACLADGKVLPCGLFNFCYDDGSGCFLELYIPMSALSDAYPAIGGYPINHRKSTQCWREPLDAWLAEIGKHVFQHAKFREAKIGFEPSDFDASIGFLPKPGHLGYLRPEGDKLIYYPAAPWR